MHTKTKVTRGCLSQENSLARIRIYPAKSGLGAGKKVFTFDSPLWKCVGFVEIEGIRGREHDRYIYDEER